MTVWDIASALAIAAAVFIATLAGCAMQRSVDTEAADAKDSAAAFAMIGLVVAIGFAAIGWWAAR